MHDRVQRTATIAGGAGHPLGPGNTRHSPAASTTPAADDRSVEKRVIWVIALAMLTVFVTSG